MFYIFFYTLEGGVFLKMAVDVKRKQNESVESMLRRFTKKVQQSRVLYRAKQIQFRQQPKNKRKIREDALRRRGIHQRREFLRKIGKLPDIDNSRTNSQWSSMYRMKLHGGNKTGNKTVKK